MILRNSLNRRNFGRIPWQDLALFVNRLDKVRPTTSLPMQISSHCTTILVQYYHNVSRLYINATILGYLSFIIVGWLDGFASEKAAFSAQKRDFLFALTRKTAMSLNFDLSSSYDTILHPCGLETIYLSGKSYLVCGCYELKEEEQVREGCFEVCHISSLNRNSLEQVHTLRFTGGVLDFKLDGDVILASLSTERYCTFKVSDTGGQIAIQKDLEFHKEGAGLFLSSDFNNCLRALDSDIVATTQSSSIIHTKLTNSGKYVY